MDPFKKSPIGRTGLRVTQFGFGTAPLGGFRGPMPASVRRHERLLDPQAPVPGGG